MPSPPPRNRKRAIHIIWKKTDSQYWRNAIYSFALGIGLALGGVLLLLIGLVIIGGGIRRGEDGRPSSVKANMHTLQTAVETYALDWKGKYPRDLQALKTEATRPGREYWKEFTNPYTGQSGLNLSYTDKLLPPGSNRDSRGLVIYSPVTSSQGIASYYIYGLGKSGERIQDRGHDLTLSNS